LPLKSIGVCTWITRDIVEGSLILYLLRDYLLKASRLLRKRTESVMSV